MAMDLSALRAAFAKKSEQPEGNNGFWDSFYPFYKMGFDEVATFRFLPDADDENPMSFVMENKYHELMINGKRKRIACLKMFGEACPCCEKSSEYYNAGDTRMGKTFWRKIDYIASGLVVSSPFEYLLKDTDNPVRLVSMSKQLYEKLETEIVKGDLDALPFDMENGYDFRIIKNKKIVPSDNGGPAKEYGNYSDSGFARRSTSIDVKFTQNENFKLVDLKNFRFTKVEREAMEAMIEAAMTGRSYDDSKEAEAQSTSGQNTGNPSLDAKLNEKPASVQTEAVQTESAPVTSAPTASVKLSPQEILAKLKARQS